MIDNSEKTNLSFCSELVVLRQLVGALDLNGEPTIRSVLTDADGIKATGIDLCHINV